MPRGIDHIGITVPSIEAATRFLIGAFGAEVLYDSHSPDQPPQQGAETRQRLHLAPGTKILQIRMLRLHNGPGIELFQMKGSSQATPALPSDLGLQHFALYVDDLAETTARFSAAGGEIFAAAHALPPLESGDGNLFCYGRAPWGTVIEFVTYPSRQPYRDETPLRRWTPTAG